MNNEKTVNNFEQEAFVRGFTKAASAAGLSHGQTLDLLTVLQTPAQTKQAESNAADKIASLLSNKLGK